MHVNFNERGIDSVICTIDKDLLNTPGYHYNPTKGTFAEINPTQAIKLYMMQILTGDTADNIAGLPRVGPVAAMKILDIAEGDQSKWGQLVKDAYAQKFPEDWEKRFTLARKQLWIHQKPQPGMTIEMIDKPVLVQGLDLPGLLTPAQENHAAAYN